MGERKKGREEQSNYERVYDGFHVQPKVLPIVSIVAPLFG